MAKVRYAASAEEIEAALRVPGALGAALGDLLLGVEVLERLVAVDREPRLLKLASVPARLVGPPGIEGLAHVRIEVVTSRFGLWPSVTAS